MATMVKANELKQGDVIHTEIYSWLWRRMVVTTAVVMSVNEFSGNHSIMAKARDGMSEMIVDVFVKSGEQVEKIA